MSTRNRTIGSTSTRHPGAASGEDTATRGTLGGRTSTFETIFKTDPDKADSSGSDRAPEARSLFADLAAEPVAMLPVRIETRFLADNTELRVRIFPDAVHVHSHLEAVSPEEARAGIGYWNDRLAGDPAGAWKTLVRRIRPTRAAWVAEALTPANLGAAEAGAQPVFPDPQINEAPWAEPPKATTLPARWAVAAYRAGELIYLGYGEPIPDDLPLGPAPDLSVDDDPETQDLPADDQSDLPIDIAMSWMTEYDAAQAAGMALTIFASEVTGGFADGIERLVVLGLPRGGATDLADLLAAHRYTEGLAFVSQGTPTNNTEGVPSGFDAGESALAASLDPLATAPALTGESNARVLATALGTGEKVLDLTLGAGGQESADAARMNGLLWETTWGYFIDNFLDPVVDDAAAASMREHFLSFVRGRGPLPAIRVGDQPYGVLPVLSGSHFRGTGELESTLARIVGRLTGLWGHASERSPFLTRGLEPAEDLLDVLESTPHSVSLRARSVIGPEVMANVDAMTKVAASQEALANVLAKMVLDGQRVRGADMIVRNDPRRLGLPFVTSEPLSETEPLSPNYLFELLVTVRRGGDFASIQKNDAPALLAVLVHQAAQLEIAKAAARLVLNHRFGRGDIPEFPRKVAPPEPEIVDLVDDSQDSLFRFATEPYGPISGTASMAEYLAALTLEQLDASPLTAPLAGFIRTLDALKDRPTAELQRLVAETLDLCSHRVDAWISSLATRRLADIRATAPTALHVGGFGWVEDLKPDHRPDSLGYVHAPSVAQATTAAILRSAHFAHREAGGSGDDPFAIDLSAQRVRGALRLMDGVRGGQSVNALLGYRFERGLHEENIELAQYILDFRKLAPLALAAGPNPSEPLEDMAARDVVDGLKLLEMYENLGDALFNPPPTHVPGIVAAPEHHIGIRNVLERLVELLDAASDLLVAEGVHQTAHGNPERGAAALEALDRQSPPPDPAVVRTPRTGAGVAHRLLISLNASAPAPGWPSDSRALAEPRLDAWAGQLLGDPSRYRFAAEVVQNGEGDSGPSLQADPSGPPAVLEVVETSLDQIGISALSVIWAAAEGGVAKISELDERIARALIGQMTATGDGLELRLREEDHAVGSWPAGTVGLANLHLLAARIRAVVTAGRSALPEDFCDPNQEHEAPLDEAEHEARAATAETSLRTLASDLGVLVAASAPPDEQRVIDTLEQAASFGIGGVLPDAPDRHPEQLELAHRVVRRRVENLEQTGVDAAARLEAIFGNGFVSLPLFTPPDTTELAASLTDRQSLLAGDMLAPATWLQRSALVRPAANQLVQVLEAAETIGSTTGMSELDIVQLPAEAGDRWLALPLNGNQLPKGNIGVVIHTPGGFDPALAQAGLVIDEWNEVIPNPVETTAVSFHYDAPAARAPQVLLLAVPPDRAAASWTLDQLLDTLLETMDMARLRAIDPQRLWMINRALPAIYLAANADDQAPSGNVYTAEAKYRAEGGAVVG